MQLEKIRPVRITEGSLGRLFKIASTGKIEWHSTTPRNFLCEEGCRCCCGPTYYFDDEVAFLGRKVRSRLKLDRGMWVPELDKGRGCCFFEGSSLAGYGCGIHDYSPLRCRMYPYWPIIVGDRIVIMAEPLCDVFQGGSTPPWHICYGLGVGPDVSVCVEGYSRDFLTSLILDVPGMLSGSVFRRAEDLLSEELIGYHRDRLYKTHREALPHILEMIRDKGSH